jgi:hypothetical protein
MLIVSAELLCAEVIVYKLTVDEYISPVEIAADIEQQLKAILRSL